jgi:serine/threonine-protein kinase
MASTSGAEIKGTAGSRRCGDYALVHELGQGAHGTVWRAFRIVPVGGAIQEVAIKIISARVAKNSYFTEKFRTEAQLAASMQHPNVVSLIEADPDGEWIALELVNGVNLRELLETVPRQRLSPEFATLIAIELCKALVYMHAHARGEVTGVVHRDISPKNVLISYDGSVKLTDFGVASVMHCDEEPQTTVAGKDEYMAPEQALKLADRRSDLFSLGVLLYEMLAGHRPVQGASRDEIRAQFEARKYSSLSSAVPQVSVGLAAIVERLLQPEPSQRFASARACLHAFSELVKAEVFVACDLYLELGQLAVTARRKATLDPETILRHHRETVLDLSRVAPAEPTTLTSQSPLEPPTIVAPSPPELLQQCRQPSPDSASRAPASASRHRGGEPFTRAVYQVPSTPTPIIASPFPAEGRLVPARRLALAAALTLACATSVWFFTSPPVPFFSSAIGVAQSVAAPTLAPPVAAAVVPLAPVTSESNTNTPPTTLVDRHAANPSVASKDSPSRPVTQTRGPTERTRSSGALSATAGTAELRVGALPTPDGDWSANVWIDGKPYGEAPVTAKVAAGKHMVAIGKERPTTNKTVVLRAGEHRDLIFGDESF